MDVCVGFREVSEAVEKEEAAISLGDTGDSVSEDASPRERGVASWLRRDNSGDAGRLLDSGGSDSAGVGGRELS